MLATWGTSTGRNPTLDLQFAGATSLDNRITFSRGTTATYFNSAGVLTTAGTSDARFDYNPSTLAAQGLLIEEQRTNSIRNNTMQGAVAGTPGTLPTNWGVFTSLTGLTRTIVGTGTENGITYIDIRLNGTPSGAGDYQIYPESLTQVVAASGQSWDSSFYYKLQSGSLTGITALQASVIERDAAGTFLAGTFTNVATPSATLVRGDTTRTLSNASTARVSGDIRITLTGAAIDITLRIGLPQLEQGAFATSVIPTTTTALTRNADVASMTGTNFSSWFNQVEGTVVCSGSRYALIPSGSFANFWAISDNTANERYIVYNTGAGQTIDASVTDGGVAQGTLIAVGSITANTTISTAFAYKVNDLALTRNATSVQVDTSATLPTVDRLYIGSNQIGGGQWSGYVTRLSYYPVRLPNSTLQALTA